MKTKIEIWRHRDKLWYWHIKRAGRIVADSGESYSSKTKLKKSLNNLIDSLSKLNFEVKEVD